MENRNGLCVAVSVADANPATERTEAVRLLKTLRRRGFRPTTVGGDKAYDTAQFVEDVRALGITPHVAQNITKSRGSMIDARTTRHAGYTVSQWCRKQVEEILGGVRRLAACARPATAVAPARGSGPTSWGARTTCSGWRSCSRSPRPHEHATQPACSTPRPPPNGAATKPIRRSRTALIHPRGRAKAMEPVAITTSSATC